MQNPDPVVNLEAAQRGKPTEGGGGMAGKNKGGKPRAVKSAEELERIVDEYILHNQDANRDDVVPPTDFDFCEFSGISPSTLDNYIRETEKYEGYLAALKKLFQYREQYFLAAGLKNPKLAGVTNFALKQRKNGGYEDRPTVQVEARELTIKTGEGMPKGAFE